MQGDAQPGQQVPAAGRASRRGRRRLPHISVRTRVITVIALVSALGMLSVGVIVYAVERQRIVAQIEERLEVALESARFIVEDGEVGSGEWASATQALAAVVQRVAPDDNTGAMGIVDGRAALVPGVPLDVDLQDFSGLVPRVIAETERSGAVIGSFTFEGDTIRYLATALTIEGSPAPNTVQFVMAYDVGAELREIDTAARVFLIAAASAIVVIVVVGALVASRLLRPVREMRRMAERISGQALSERLPIRGNDDVSQLASTMNDMLDRLDGALESQRSLLSDVGHELKTPITIVRGHVEVMDAANQADVEETRALVVDELDRMGRLVQDLARAAALHGPAPVRPLQTDAADLTEHIIRLASATPGAEVTAGEVADVVAPLDGERLTQAMLQLVQNAVSHGDGEIVIGSAVVGDSIEFSVRDHGPGVPDGDKARVFERFQRGGERDGGDGADGAAPHAPGSGLGLAIVQTIARGHGGLARVGDAPGGGAVFVISVPLGARGMPRPAAPRLPATPTTNPVDAAASSHDDGAPWPRS